MLSYGSAYVTALVGLWLDLWPYMLLSFVVAGIVEEFVPEDRLLHVFGDNDLASLLRALAAGFVISACSCGAIALVASIRRRGASTAAALTFLLAAPWLGLPMLAVYVAFLGGPLTLGLVFVSLATALAAGLVLAALERRGAIATGKSIARGDPDPGNAAAGSEAPATCGCGSSCASEAAVPADAADAGRRVGEARGIVDRLVQRLPRHVWNLAKGIGLYLLIGTFVAALPKAFVSPETVTRWLGQATGARAIFVALPVAAVIEACSEGFAVIAGQLYEMGASVGVVFVVTMVGVATDLTEVTVAWGAFGRRTALVYLGVGTFATVCVGLLLQALV